MELVVGFLVGIATGLITNYVWIRWWPRVHYAVAERRQGGPHPLSYDPRNDGFYVINRWSPARRLRPDRHELLIVENRPKSRWFDDTNFNELVSRYSSRAGGTVGYLVDFDIDNHESRLGEFFRMYVARASYPEHLATTEILRTNPQVRSDVARAIESRDLKAFARSAPPSSISATIAVVNPKGEFLVLQRSSAVDVARNQWVPGAAETLKLPDRSEPGADEDLFSLVERGLNEELGLLRADYGEIHISWIGYYEPLAKVHVVAEVLTLITKTELARRIAGAHSIYEHQAHMWLPLRKETIDEIVGTPVGEPDKQGRRWADEAPLDVQEIWRMRGVLLRQE